MSRISIYNKLSKKELQDIIDSSDSIKEVIQKIGLSAKGTGPYHFFHTKVKELGLEINELKKRSKKLHTPKNFKCISLKKVLVENSNYTRTELRRRLLKENILNNVCSICGQLPEWNGKPLTLQLDHINGVYNDNRLENLRIVCPHCHSQLKTSKKEKIIKTCTDCGKIIFKTSKRCRACAMKKDGIKKVTFNVSKEELEKLIWKEKLSYAKIGKLFGVSDNAIRKRAKKLGIKIRKRAKRGG